MTCENQRDVVERLTAKTLNGRQSEGIPIQNVTTVYPRIGDAHTRTRQVFLLMSVIVMIVGHLRP